MVELSPKEISDMSYSSTHQNAYATLSGAQQTRRCEDFAAKFTHLPSEQAIIRIN